MSWVLGYSMARLARTALRSFSTACWAWKPIFSSVTSRSWARLSITTLSARALLRSSRAWSWLSRGGNDSTLGECLVQHGALNLAPRGDVIGADDHDVGSDAEPAQFAPKPHRFLAAVLDGGFDYEEVQVAVRASVASRVGSEQD